MIAKPEAANRVCFTPLPNFTRGYGGGLARPILYCSTDSESGTATPPNNHESKRFRVCKTTSVTQWRNSLVCYYDTDVQISWTPTTRPSVSCFTPLKRLKRQSCKTRIPLGAGRQPELLTSKTALRGARCAYRNFKTSFSPTLQR